MRGGGFFAGAVGGLALALLLVGVASFLPHSGVPIQTASVPQGGAASAASTRALVASTTTNGSSQFIAAQSGAENAAAGAPATSSTAAAPGSVATSSSSAQTAPNAVSGTNEGVVASGAPQRPSSMLAVLPGESLEGLIATVSPLVVALLVAVLVYGAYARRQDSAS